MSTTTDSVRLVLFNTDNPSRFLVLTEADDPDNWKLTGGKFDSADETPAAAAARELYEELGLSATAVSLRQAGELVNDDGVSARYIFAGATTPAEVQPSNEILAVRWVDETGIPDSPNRGHILSAVQLAQSFIRAE